MRILLIKPSLSSVTLAGNDFVELEPLELEYLAGILRDHDVQLLDMRCDAGLEARIAEFNPDVVASTAYSVHVKNVLAIMRAVKEISTDIFTVVGGHHATVMPHDFQRHEVDAIVIGEGVFTFGEVVQSLDRGLSLERVPGLLVKGEDGSHVFTEARNDVEKIDRFPLPDRNVTSEYRHNYFYLWWKPAALIRASTGCAYRCNFCPIWKANGGKWEYRSPLSVVEELSTIAEDFVYFCDDNAFFDGAKMNALYHFIKERGIDKEYFFFARPDTLARHPDLVEKWAEIGLRQVFLGIEAVDTETLKALNKRFNAKVNEEAVAILKTNGVDPFAGFIVFPDFTTADFERIYEYMEKLGIYFHEITVLTPAPGSDLFWDNKELLTTMDYELFDYVHAVLPTKLSLREFYRQLARLYVRGYSPLRAIRLKPAARPPMAPGYMITSLLRFLKNYRAIKYAYETHPQARPVLDEN